MKSILTYFQMLFFIFLLMGNTNLPNVVQKVFWNIRSVYSNITSQRKNTNLESRIFNTNLIRFIFFPPCKIERHDISHNPSPTPPPIPPKSSARGFLPSAFILGRLIRHWNLQVGEAVMGPGIIISPVTSDLWRLPLKKWEADSENLLVKPFRLK